MRQTKTVRTLLLALLALAGCSASSAESNDDERLPESTRTPGYESGASLEVRVGRSTGVTLAGLGVELDPHFLSQNVTRHDGAKASDWDEIVVPRIRKMGIQRFRVMLLPHWWEPLNDNGDPGVAALDRFTFESAEMRSLYKVLDIAQEMNADVTLVLWGCPTYCDLLDPAYAGVKRHFLCSSEGTNWVVEPADSEEFAESFSTVVKHLIERRGYTCIKELTPFNEPDGNIIPLERYVPLAKVLDRRLRADGIRDKVRLNLSDNTDTRRFFLEGCARELSQEADLFNSHTYIFGYDTPNSTVLAWEEANVAAAATAGKKHFVGEFGSNQCVGATRQTDIDRYDRGVLMTRLVVNFLNAGAVGTSYWSLIDQYYGRNESYAAMQQLGMWRYMRAAYRQDPDPGVYDRLTDDYQPRPQYYAYSLLTRFVRKGSEVYPLDLGNEFAAGTAVRAADGRWTYVIANATDETLSFDLKNTLRGGMSACKVYVYEERRLPDGDELIAPSLQLENSGSTFCVGVKARSVIVLTQPGHLPTALQTKPPQGKALQGFCFYRYSPSTSRRSGCRWQNKSDT